MDFILISGEDHYDHPMSPSGVIKRVLESKGFSVGVIVRPGTDKDYMRHGMPKLAFLVTSRSIDSMLNNNTPLKKLRSEDKHNKTTPMPDRAVIYYCNQIRRLVKGARIVIGGVEASLRRFSHYDYWDNALRRSILLDSRADILVYGSGEKQIIEIAERMREGKPLDSIRGTCIVSKTLPQGFETLPTAAEVKDPRAFCRMQMMFSVEKDLVQEDGGRYVLQHRYPEYTTEELDWIYGLPYSRKVAEGSLLTLSRFSVVTHRGCIGNCSFCAIAMHQGAKIVSRSEDSIISEIKALTEHPDFKGYIDDLGGPSANMYGMDCHRCENDCISCKRLDKSHSRVISLLKKARAVPGVKKAFVRSGVRYDLANDAYLEELAHHVSGILKVAPEHLDHDVLRLMNKENEGFFKFCGTFRKIDKKSAIKAYLMVGHPGDSLEKVRKMKQKLGDTIDSVQLFTPTPMTISTCMYWTGLDPRTMKKVNVIRDYHTKKELKRLFYE